MTAAAGERIDRRGMAAAVAPVLVVALAGVAIRTPPAAAHPLAALLLFVWLAADMLLLSLVARTGGRPGGRAVVATLAGAGVTVWLGATPAMRHMLVEMPVLAAAMAAIVAAHGVWGAVRAGRLLAGAGGRARWIAALSQIVPPALVRLAAAELAVLHVALFRWGGPADVPPRTRAFAYHRHLTPVCATLLVLSAIEAAVWHLLFGQWSRTATLVLFVLSDGGFLYLLGLIKSFRLRPVLVTAEGVRIRAGFLIDRLVPFEAIVAVDRSVTGGAMRDPATLNAALLAWPNILLHLDRPVPRRGLLRDRASFVRIAIRLDDPDPFVRLLVWRLGRCGGGGVTNLSDRPTQTR